jgi:diacylglycerol kinase family enzyme
MPEWSKERVMAVNRERKLVSKEAAEIYFNSHTLDEAIAKLEAYRASYGGNAKIQQQRQYDDEYLALMVEQPETDQQMARRIAQEVRDDALREERDRREFERLANKFGKA